MPATDALTARRAALDRFLDALRPSAGHPRGSGGLPLRLVGAGGGGSLQRYRRDRRGAHGADVRRALRDYLPAIVAAGIGVQMLVYTPEEFEALMEEERPFLVHALEGARSIHEG